jgi:hypothetical protein
MTPEAVPIATAFILTALTSSLLGLFISWPVGLSLLGGGALCAAMLAAAGRRVRWLVSRRGASGGSLVLLLGQIPIVVGVLYWLIRVEHLAVSGLALGYTVTLFVFAGLVASRRRP